MNVKTSLFALTLLSSFLASAAPIVKTGDRIGFLGDSITQYGNNGAGYVNLVMKGLEVAGVKAEKVPAGISGNKSPQMLARVDGHILSRKVQFMTLSCGVNDVWHGKNGVELEDYKKNISQILDKAEAAGVKVIVLTSTMITEDEKGANNLKLDTYNAWLKEEAARRNLPLADLNADMKAELARIRATDKTPGNKLTRDGVHMAFPGDCLMAWGVLRAMGVEEAQKAAIVAAWNDMPGAYRHQFDLSANENAKLKATGKTAEQIVREAIGAK